MSRKGDILEEVVVQTKVGKLSYLYKDELLDGDEIDTYHTDPLLYDTDGDTIGDGDEIKIGLNPLSTVTNGIPDNEYTFEQQVSEEALAYVNTEDNDYTVSIDLVASGNAADNVVVATS